MHDGGIAMNNDGAGARENGHAKIMAAGLSTRDTEVGNCCRWQGAEEREHDGRLAMSYDGAGAREHRGVKNIEDSSGAVDQEHECAQNFVGRRGEAGARWGGER